jgi:hypothetical protein
LDPNSSELNFIKSSLNFLIVGDQAKMKNVKSENLPVTEQALRGDKKSPSSTEKKVKNVYLPENENTKQVHHTEHFFAALQSYGWKIYLKCPFCRMARPCGHFLDLEEDAIKQMEIYEQTFKEDSPVWKQVCDQCHRKR